MTRRENAGADGPMGRTAGGVGRGQGPVNRIVAGLSLRRKIGQMMVVGFPEHFEGSFSGGNLPEGILSLLADPGVGGVGLFARNAKGPGEMAELTSCLQEAARALGAPVPLFIMADQEGGIVMQVTEGTTVFPGNMALGATGDPATAYEAARIIGLEALAMGINAVTAPDVDVNADADNPIIGVRAYGDDPALVSAFAEHAVRGFGSAGVLCMAKHFPGHGRTALDSHLGMPRLDGDAEELESVDLPPFAAAIAGGATGIMTAHIQSAALDPSGTCATLSRPILTGLLRERMRFDGLIITDCLEMGAVQQTVGTARAAVEAVVAGADMVLICHTLALQRQAVDMLEQAVRFGEIDEERIDQSCRRIVRRKLALEAVRRGMWEEDGKPPLGIVGCREHLLAEERIARQSVTLVRNEDGVLPLAAERARRIAVVYPATMPRLRAEDIDDDHTVLGREIAARGIEVVEIGVGLSPTIGEVAAVCDAVVGARVDAVVVATSCKTAEQERAQGSLVQALLAAVRGASTGSAGDPGSTGFGRCDIPVIGCAIRNPYDIRSYPGVRTYLVTYGYRPCSIRAAVEVIFGETVPLGRLPVEIPGMYPRGYGLVGFREAVD